MDKVKKKMEQMASVLEVMDDLAHSGDVVMHEMRCAIVLIKGIYNDIESIIEKDI